MTSMKKIIFFLFALCMGAVVVNATDLKGVKIYINPGHGGYDPNDRSVATIPFPVEWLKTGEGFWESKSNLIKGLYLRDLLLASNATVMISRTENTSGAQDVEYYPPGTDLSKGGDRNLQTIAAESNAFQPDGFLSIHSNAMGSRNGSTNYLLFMFSGYNNAPIVPSSKTYALAAWPFLIDNPLTSWGTTETRVQGDIDWYGSGAPNGYLGVLRNQIYTAFLSEGSFHDYHPETHRLLNADYCKLEAIKFSQFFHSYHHADLPNTGTIGGWVKSANEKNTHPLYLYRAGSPDQWLPLNGATVKLLNAAGNTVLQTYTTDDWYNGIFVFYNIAPGNYKVAFEKTDYISDTATVTVAAGKIVYPKMQLFNTNIPVPHDVAPDYPELGNPGAVALDNYNFYEINKAQPSWLSDATTIKRAIHRNDKIYVLTTEPKVYVIDALTYTLVRELDMTGITGGINSILSDIAFTADNYLVGCNKETIPYSPGSRYFKVYTWDNDVAAPRLLFQSQAQALWNDGVLGQTFAVSGIRSNLKVYTSAKSLSSASIRLIGIEYEDVNGTAVVAAKYMGGNADGMYNTTTWGDNHIFTISPSGDGDHFYIDSDIMLPTEYKFDWAANERSALILKGTFAEKSGYQLGTKPSGINIFRLANHIFMASPVCESTAANVGVVLFDITNGLDKAVKVSEKYPSAGLGTTPATYMAAGSKITGYDIDLIIWAKNQGIGRYRTSPSTGTDIYASELSITASNEFKFTLNANATSVIIKLYDSNFNLSATFDKGALQKGTHVIAEDFSALPSGRYTWNVTAKAAGIDRPGLVSNNAAPLLFYQPRGVAVDNSTESPFFGRIYVSEANGGLITAGSPNPSRTVERGIYILDAALSDVTNQGVTSYKGGITWGAPNGTGYQYGPLRLNVAEDGKVYIPDSHYNNSGVWIMNPANPSANFVPVFGGTRNNSTGAVTNGGTTINNPIPSCYVIGAESSTQLFTLDRPSGTPKDATINRYDIGDLSGLPWTAAPSAKISTGGLLANCYGTIAPDGNGGWWVAQYRSGSGDVGVPCFFHLTNGTVDFSASNAIYMETPVVSSYQGSLAVNCDGSLLAVGGAQGTVNVYGVVYSATNAPTITLKYAISTGGTTDNIQGLAFDVAGNLYVVSEIFERLKVYGLPKSDNSFTTTAKANHALIVNNNPIDEPNIYASELSFTTVDSIAYTFSYTLNAQASSLVLEVLDNGNNVVRTVNITGGANLSKGVHKYTTNIIGLSSGTYKWRLTPTGVLRSNSTTVPTKVSNDDPQFKHYDPRSIAVDNTFDSPFFGRIYICDAQGQSSTAGAAGEGIFILNAALSDTTKQNDTGYKGGITWSATSSPFRASVAPDGKVYIADWSDVHTGIWIMNPANPTTTFNPVFGGTRANSGLASSGGVNIHGSISHCWITGTGADTKLYTFDEDYIDAVATNTGNLLQYNIGNLANVWTQAPSAIVYNDVLYGNLQQNFNSCINPDGRGGWWISQNRTTNAMTIPSLVHLTEQKVLTNFGGHANITGSAQGGMALSVDGSLLAMGDAGVAKVFDITYDGSNVPTLTLKYTITGLGLGTNTHGLAFDQANNLYVVGSANGVTLATRIAVYALPKANNTFITPAPSTSVIVIKAAVVVKPTVVSTTPANAATDIAVNLGNVAVTFSEAMNAGVNGTVQIVNTQTGAVVGSVATPVWSNNNQTVTLTFTGTLDFATNYTIKVSGFTSALGGVMNEDANNKFTTLTKPVVVSSIPADGAVNVPIAMGTVSATFNKAMNSATAGTIAIKLGGATVGSVSAPVWSNNNITVTLTFTGTLSYSTTYTLEIKGFGDNGGNTIDNTNYTFTTEPKPVQKVTLFVTKDYVAWTNHGKIFNLRQNGEVKYIGDDNLDGTVTFQDVEDGVYRLYDGLQDGAINVRDQLVYGTTGFSLAYYTVRFGVQNDGKASGSVIEAVYNGKAVKSGDVIVEGKRLTLIAKGNGAATYTYLWTGNFNGTEINVAGDAISADVLSNIVDVHCVITGTSDEIIISNVLTPNGDGKNDNFVIQGLEAYQSNELVVFNRNRVEVFRAKNYKNGTWNGANLVDDVYFYTLNLVDENGRIITKTGYVHLKK